MKVKKIVFLLSALVIVTGCSPVEKTIDNMTSQLFEDLDELDTPKKVKETREQGGEKNGIGEKLGKNE